MKLLSIQTFDITDPEQKQFHRIVLLKSGTVVGLFSQNDRCYLQWFSAENSIIAVVPFITDEIFASPALFHFDHYVGVYAAKNDFVVLFDEHNKTSPIKIGINNRLPAIRFPQFNKPLSNYQYAGNSDDNIIPVLFTNGGLLPVYIAHLQIDVAGATASWLNLQYWNNKKTISLGEENFTKPEKPFTILHALRKQGTCYAYGIGNRDSGYLKPGMEFSELVSIHETGIIKETLFSLGRLYKEAKKGGKECIFSSSGEYAILTPVYKSDDWKNKQKLFHLTSRQLIAIELPKELSNYRIIDHNNDSFLLADNYINLVFANTRNIATCKFSITSIL